LEARKWFRNELAARMKTPRKKPMTIKKAMEAHIEVCHGTRSLKRRNGKWEVWETLGTTTLYEGHSLDRAMAVLAGKEEK